MLLHRCAYADETEPLARLQPFWSDPAVTTALAADLVLPWSHSRRSSATFLKCMHAEGERQQPVLSLPLQENPSLGGLDNWTSEVTLQKGLPRVTTPSSQRSSCV